MRQVSPSRPHPRGPSWTPASVYITESRSGQMRRPCSVTSSPVLTTAVISSSGHAARTPRRNRAPPMPPARTAILTQPNLRHAEFGFAAAQECPAFAHRDLAGAEFDGAGPQRFRQVVVPAPGVVLEVTARHAE